MSRYTRQALIPRSQVHYDGRCSTSLHIQKKIPFKYLPRLRLILRRAGINEIFALDELAYTVLRSLYKLERTEKTNTIVWTNVK